MFLAGRLAARGATVYLIPFNLRTAECRVLDLDLILLNNLYKTLDSFSRFCLERYPAVCVLDNEGAVWTCFEEYERALSGSAEIRSEIDRVLCWGGSLAGRLVSSEKFRPSQISVTGHPRMDFYAPIWRDALLRSTAHISYPDRFVLIAPNHPLANPRFQTVDREVEVLVENGYSREGALAYLELDRSRFEAMKALASDLAAAAGDLTFVIRPHPFENPEPYVQLAARRENLIVAQRGTVDGWLARASALIQRSSTTAIEAGLLGKLSLTPGWVPPLDKDELPTRISLICPTLVTLCERAREASTSSVPLPPHVHEGLKTVCDEWIGEVDGDAGARVAAQLRELALLTKKQQSSNSEIVMPSASGTVQARRSLVQRTRDVLANPLLGPAILLHKFSLGRVDLRHLALEASQDPARIAWDSSAKAFDLAEVSRLQDCLMPCLRRNGVLAHGQDMDARAASFPCDYARPIAAPRSIVIAQLQN